MAAASWRFTVIRSLRPGEQIPAGEPRRYLSSQGYVRLRWRVGPGQLVETYEHRVHDGFVTTSEEIHHRNGVHDDNRPENLEPIGKAEHKARHRRVDRAEAVRLYEGGSTTIAIGEALGCSPATLSRILRAEGVEMRHDPVNRRVLSEEQIRRWHAEGVRADVMAERLGHPTAMSVRRTLRELGLPAFPPGRPRGPGVAPRA